MIDKIRDDMKAAMKDGKKAAVRALRMLLTAIKNKQIELGKEPSEQDIVALVQKAVKSRRESIEQFRKGNRNDLAEQEEEELAVLEQYLPKQLSEEEIRELVDKVIAEEGAVDKRDFGKVMKRIMTEYRGQVDGKVVQQIVNEKLSG